MRLVCKPCHELITLADRFGLSESEAVIRKQTIAFSKLKPAEQEAELVAMGVIEIPKAKAKRRALYELQLSKQ